MVHFALLCPTANGHLNPMTSLGYTLRQRGHRVTLVGTLDAEAKAIAAGIRFYPIDEQDFPLGSSQANFKQLGELSGLAALKYTIELFRQVTLMQFREVPPVLKNIGTDLLIVDQASLGGITLAQQLDLPFVSVACALMLNRDPWVPPFNLSWPYRTDPWGRLRNRLGYRILDQLTQPIRAVLSAERQRLGLYPIDNPNDGYSTLAQVCQQPSSFEFPRSHLPNCFHFTGPLATPASREPTSFPYDQLTGQPVLRASPPNG